MELISLIRISAHGSSCSTAVDQRSKTLEVVGLNSARCWAFSSLLYPISSASLHSGPSWRCNTSDFPNKICLAMHL